MSSGLRILHVIDSLAPGGTERQCVQLARGLSQLGAKNRVVHFRSGSILAELRHPGTDALAMPMTSFRSARFPARVLALSRAMRAWRPDVVQTYGFYSNVPGLLAATLARVPVRIGGRRDLGAHLSPLQRRADRHVWRLADRVVANSDAVRQHLIGQRDVRPDKIVVIRNGLDVRTWLPLAPGGDDARDALVGMVAHFREQKDHGTFLAAAKEILAIAPTVRFCLVGAGVLEPAIRELAHRLGVAENVDFLGALEGEALRAVMRRFRVSVLTSKNNEGLPNVVLEAMAVGLPVVATTVGGAREVIEHGVTGFLVPPGDPAALTEHVVHLLKEPSLARQMGDNARRRIERDFTIERMVGQFHALYRTLRAGRG